MKHNFKPGTLVRFCATSDLPGTVGGWLKINEDDTSPEWKWIYMPENGIFLYIEERMFNKSIRYASLGNLPVVLFEDKLIYMLPEDIEAYEP